MSDYSRPQSREELEHEKRLNKLKNTEVLALMSKGITIAQLARVLKTVGEYSHSFGWDELKEFEKKYL